MVGFPSSLVGSSLEKILYASCTQFYFHQRGRLLVDEVEPAARDFVGVQSCGLLSFSYEFSRSTAPVAPPARLWLRLDGT